jgi:hypothetical protein
MKPKEQTDSMRNRRSSVIVRMMLVFAPCLVACAEVEADGSRKFLIYPLAQPSPGLTFNNTQAQVRAAAGDAQLQLLATVGHARVSEPEQMAAVLGELRLESAAHLGRLDQEERTEMMAAMRGAGVALGDRNKLRLLTAERHRNAAKGLSANIGSYGVRRVQQDGQEESRTNQQLKKQAEEHAGTAQPTGAQASGAVSSDSAFAYVKTLN